MLSRTSHQQLNKTPSSTHRLSEIPSGYRYLYNTYLIKKGPEGPVFMYIQFS